MEKYIKPQYRNRKTRNTEKVDRDNLLESDRFRNLDWFEMTAGQMLSFCKVSYDKQKATRSKLGLNLQKKNSKIVGEYSQYTYTSEQMQTMAEELNMFLVQDTKTDRVFVCRAVKEYK